MLKNRFLFLAVFFALGAPGSFAIEVEKISRVLSGKVKTVEVAKGRVFVRFSKNVSSAARSGILESVGVRQFRDFDFINMTLALLPEGMGVSDGIKRLKAIKGVEIVEPDYIYRVRKIPNDSYINAQYALKNIDAFGAWEYETGFSSRVTIAIMDTGIDGQNPEVSGKLIGISKLFDPNNLSINTDTTESDNQPPTAACVHATRVASIAAAAADNSHGIAGVSWGAKLLSLKVFADEDCPSEDCMDESCRTDEGAMISAINYATSLSGTTTYGKIVLNMSLGSEGECSFTMQTAVTTAYSSGVVLIAASGNYSANVNSPANCSYVIPVGATDSEDKIAVFSTTGLKMRIRGVTAPGVSIYAATYSGSNHDLFAYDSGTSFATPIVSGVAALIYSANPQLSSYEVSDIIRNTADDLGAAGPDDSYGYGRVNAFKAVRYAAAGSLSDFDGDVKAIAFPNPFRPSKDTFIHFSFPQGASFEELQIKIYTMEGEIVKKFSGLVWDGKNDAGAPVSSGIYVFFARGRNKNYKGKFALIR